MYQHWTHSVEESTGFRGHFCCCCGEQKVEPVDRNLIIQFKNSS